MAATDPPSLLLHTVENLAEFHREHEKFYAAAPREQAVVLQRHASTLHEVADRAAAALDGVLFLEGQGEPAGLAALRREIRALGEEAVATGEWMTKAMQAAWTAAAALLDIAALDDLIGERHRIIANDWQAAGATVVVGRLLERAADVLDRVDADATAGARTPGCCTRPASSSPAPPTCSASRPAWCRRTSGGGGCSRNGWRRCWPWSPRPRPPWLPIRPPEECMRPTADLLDTCTWRAPASSSRSSPGRGGRPPRVPGDVGPARVREIHREQLAALEAGRGEKCCVPD